MRGFNVLHPMGWDAFGLPLKTPPSRTTLHPLTWTRNNIHEFQRVLRRFGFSYDWRREISTCDPQYYVGISGFFCACSSVGLAYRKKSRVNWCPKCCTVLANEQVVNGGLLLAPRRHPRRVPRNRAMVPQDHSTTPINSLKI